MGADLNINGCWPFGDALLSGIGLRALLAGLLASVTYAAYYVASGAVAAGRSAARVLAVAMFAAALVLAPFARTARASPAGWACLALLAVVYFARFVFTGDVVFGSDTGQGLQPTHVAAA